MEVSFPRYFYIGGAWLNSYQVLLCVGIYAGSLTTAALAEHSGLSPLRVGLAAALCALTGLIGARLYFLAVHAGHDLKASSRRGMWGSEKTGWSVFGALFTFVPATLVAAWLLNLPAVTLWDVMSGGVLAGGFWVRIGCVFNGCCAGRETRSRIGVWLHDTRGIRKRRLPVQYFEMAWWLIGGGVFVWCWPMLFTPGSYALGVLGWYGFGRFFLEPMRERVDVVFGHVRIDQVVAAILTIGAAGTLVARALLR